MTTSPNLAPFVERRQRFAEAIGESLAIVPGRPDVSRNSDVHYEFRQDSDFFFLTGFDEPDAVAVVNPSPAQERYVLFVRPHDREMRLRRSPAELARHRRACEISRDAHAEAMRFARPGQYEYEVQAVLEFVFRVNGSPRNGYPSIVASGPNACILHYRENNRCMEDGDLLLIDAGCEYGYYTADITRTFPVNGRFTSAQRAIYELVLRAQLAGIEAARPGNRYHVVHDTARRVLTEGLVALGLLPLPVADSLAMHHYREFYMHGTGHFLGMDGHDVGDYRMHGASRALEPGMVFTVEPGLHVDPEGESVTYSLRDYNNAEHRGRRYL